MNPTATPGEAAHLADQLERSFHGGAWHGPAFAEALDGVDAATAAHQAIPGAHTIWEIVGHVSGWMETVRCRIECDPAAPPPAEEDWPRHEDDAERDAAWASELAALEERHRRLHALVAGLDDARLDDPVPGSDPTVRGLLLGALQHHAYHGGQVVLLLKAGAAR